MKKFYEKPELEYFDFEIVEPVTDGGFGGDIGGSEGFEDEDDW